ncbi:response regulator [bacterium]|nr:response regulator [bacterium]
MNPRILCVDDDPNILSACQRHLRKEFEVDIAESGARGLARLSERGPYAVVVSDMRMPEMDGIEFLSRVKAAAPDTVRIMLTGQADLSTAMEAVNQGSIFRFLTKPCSAESLLLSLRAGAEQFRLVHAERELLEKTLSGSVKVLTDTLSLVSPAAFGRAVRVQRLMRAMARQLGAPVWEFELAALLSQVGCVSLPGEVIDKLHRGYKLSEEEQRMFDGHPQVGRDLIANIPRLAGVAEIIAFQEKHFDGSGVPHDGPRGEKIPAGARALHVALHYDNLTMAGVSRAEALRRLSQHKDWYDPAMLSALAKSLDLDVRYEVRSVSLAQLDSSMILAEEIKTDKGLLLIAQGQEVTTSLRARLRNFARTTAIKEPIKVLVPVRSATDSKEA